MEVSARLRYLRITPRKVRALANLIRGKGVNDALAILKFAGKSSGAPLHKLLSSAIANATSKDKKVDTDSLIVKTIVVDEGPMLKRFLPRSMGRANRVLKRTSHITLVVGEK
jgi:large subunit ribosomal protein L22